MQPARFSVALVCLTLHIGCTGESSRRPEGSGGLADTENDSDASSGGSGGSGSGGSGSGGSGSGGDSPGGTTSTGDLDPGECRSVADCPTPDPSDYLGAVVTAGCAAPYTTPDTIIPGVAPPPRWCSENGCAYRGPQPRLLGYTCQTDDDCQDPEEQPFAASLCRDGQCAVCDQDADCGEQLPYCAPALHGVMSCVACRTSMDCAAPKSICLNVDLVGDQCVECASTADCADGICKDHACVSECTVAHGCPDPALPCSAHARCEPADCTADAECPPNMGCQDGKCLRRSCDEGCDGVCFGGVCHEQYGHCVVFKAYP